MACPACDHTMQTIADDGNRYCVWWCPRCGTIKFPGGNTESPDLVDRCRRFESAFEQWPMHAVDLWKSIGMDEAIKS